MSFKTLLDIIYIWISKWFTTVDNWNLSQNCRYVSITLNLYQIRQYHLSDLADYIKEKILEDKDLIESSIEEETERKEPISGFYTLQNLIQENLFFITGKPLVKNQETQSFDIEALARIKALEREIKDLQQEREEDKLK